jgi:hypothetical protein
MEVVWFLVYEQRNVTVKPNYIEKYVSCDWRVIFLTLYMFSTTGCITHKATLTEVFPVLFLSCKANAKVTPAKMGHGPHSS